MVIDQDRLQGKGETITLLLSSQVVKEGIEMSKLEQGVHMNLDGLGGLSMSISLQDVEMIGLEACSPPVAVRSMKWEDIPMSNEESPSRDRVNSTPGLGKKDG